MTTYELTYDESYVVESLERYRAQNPSRPVRLALKAVGLLGLLALLALSVWAKIYPLIPIMIFFIAILAFAPKIDFWWIKRKLRKSPFYNRTLHIEVDDAGYRARSDISNVDFEWPAFAQFSRLGDGFLLKSGTDNFHWLPDSALVNGTASEITEVLEKHVQSAA